MKFACEVALMRRKTKALICDENAQALVEYALLALILTIVSFAGFKLVAAAWRNKFERVKDLRAGEKGIYP